MCGIAAIWGKESQSNESLLKMLKPISHRGEIEFFNESESLDHCVLGMNRLAIVDQENAKQPFVSKDGRYHIVFNGEIYNFIEIRKELRDMGHHFTTNSDTEVLLRAYIEWQEKSLEKLNGMFAFFIYDKIENTFFAARDPFGIKPLYWAKDKQSQYYFASEIKSLSHFEHLEEIKIFPPGHFMKSKKLQSYYFFPEEQIQTLSEEESIQELREFIDEAVKKRVQTELPIAVYLSGGIDSTAILATARKFHPDVTAIIIGNEHSTDKKIATKYCEENNIKYIVKTPPTEEELLELIPLVTQITESFEPNLVRQSTLTYHIAEAAKDFKVVLCGEGADEIFAGYPEFMDLNEDEIQKKSMSFLKDLHRTQLQRVDRCSMYFTTEVRIPFLDVSIVDFILKKPGNLKIRMEEGKTITKYLLRKAMADRLPEYIYNREKVVLSEGAGYKGNKKIGGLFYDLISEKLSDQEFEKYKLKYQDWKLETKEEVFYFKIYCELGYTKAKFNQKRVIANSINTKNS